VTVEFIATHAPLGVGEPYRALLPAGNYTIRVGAGYEGERAIVVGHIVSNDIGIAPKVDVTIRDLNNHQSGETTRHDAPADIPIVLPDKASVTVSNATRRVLTHVTFVREA